MSAFCQRLYHGKCQSRGVGGQKSQNLVNIVLWTTPYRILEPNQKSHRQKGRSESTQVASDSNIHIYIHYCVFPLSIFSMLISSREAGLAWKDLGTQVSRNGTGVSALFNRLRRLLRCLNSAENRPHTAAAVRWDTTWLRPSKPKRPELPDIFN